MSQPTALELARLVEVFNAAVENTLSVDPALQQKVATSLSQDEIVEVTTLAQEFTMKALTLVMTEGQQAAEEKLAPEAIALFDKAIVAPIRALGEDAVAALVDPAHKTAANSKGFEDLGAPNLARLYAPKP